MGRSISIPIFTPTQPCPTSFSLSLFPAGLIPCLNILTLSTKPEGFAQGGRILGKMWNSVFNQSKQHHGTASGWMIEGNLPTSSLEKICQAIHGMIPGFLGILFCSDFRIFFFFCFAHAHVGFLHPWNLGMGVFHLPFPLLLHFGKLSSRHC